MEPARDLRHLVELVARLRAPDGCPWDREQPLQDLRAYLVEEAHELAAAIDGVTGRRSRQSWGTCCSRPPSSPAWPRRPVSGARGGDRGRVAQDGRSPPPCVRRRALADAAAVARAWERRKLAPARTRLAARRACRPPCPPWWPPTGSPRRPPASASTGPSGRRLVAKLDEELAEVRQRDQPRGPAEQPRRAAATRSATCSSRSPTSRATSSRPGGALPAPTPEFRRRFGHLEASLKPREAARPGRPGRAGATLARRQGATSDPVADARPRLTTAHRSATRSARRSARARAATPART